MQMIQLLAAIDSQTWAVVAGGAVGVMVMIFFGVRFWLTSSRSSAKGIPTPNIDRLNRRALEHMNDENFEEDDDEEPPDALKAVVPKTEEKSD